MKPMHLKSAFARKAEFGSTPNGAEERNLHISL